MRHDPHSARIPDLVCIIWHAFLFDDKALASHERRADAAVWRGAAAVLDLRRAW